MLKLGDQRGRDAAAAVSLIDGKVVEIDFAARPFELGQLIGGDAADDAPLRFGDEQDDRVLVQLAFEPRVAGPVVPISFGVLERIGIRSEEHTSELQSLMRISYAVFCLKKKNQPKITRTD